MSDSYGSTRYRIRLKAGWAVLAGALAVLGTALMVIAVLAQESPPAPPRDLGTIPAARPLTPARTSPGQPGRGKAGEAAGWIGALRERPGLPPPPTAVAAATPSLPVLPRSLPVALAIPAIGVHTNLIHLGLGPRHTLQVPPLTQAGVQEAGWYDLGPTPGQVGPAVILGHVDSYQGPGVFFRLGSLRPGERIQVTRADGTVALFRVDAVDEYRKDKFPTRQVYGPVGYAGLRVITCGGRFDDQTHHYLSNIVIYATLTSSRAGAGTGRTGTGIRPSGLPVRDFLPIIGGMSITQIQLFSLPVTDQDRARDFYVDTLGFELVADTTMGPDQRWVQVRPPGAATSVTLVTWFPTMPAGSVKGTVLETGDLDGDVAALRARGVVIDAGIQEAPWGRFVTFDDPDGNGLILQATASAPPARG